VRVLGEEEVRAMDNETFHWLILIGVIVVIVLLIVPLVRPRR
jgi:hypothetical protein